MEKINIKIHTLKEQDIKRVAEIASQSFSGLKDIKKARQWITCNFRAFPRMRYFVAKRGEEAIGYILWIEKGGFREKAVFELEQIAIKEDCRGQGIGAKLIEESLTAIKHELQKRGAGLKLIEVTTATDNQAQRLYQKTLGAKPECVIKDLFRGDEVVMVARF